MNFQYRVEYVFALFGSYVSFLFYFSFFFQYRFPAPFPASEKKSFAVSSLFYTKGFTRCLLAPLPHPKASPFLYIFDICNHEYLYGGGIRTVCCKMPQKYRRIGRDGHERVNTIIYGTTILALFFRLYNSRVQGSTRVLLSGCQDHSARQSRPQTQPQDSLSRTALGAARILVPRAQTSSESKRTRTPVFAPHAEARALRFYGAPASTPPQNVRRNL